MATTLTGNTVLKLSKKEAWPLVRLVYPEYTGRKFVMEFTDRVWYHDTNWGGGTRNQYKAVKSDGRIAGFSAPAPWVNPIEGTSQPTTPDVLVIVHKVFCGQDCGIRIYAHPSLAPEMVEGGMSMNRRLEQPKRTSVIGTMRNLVDQFTDPKTDEVNATELAEYVADNFGDVADNGDIPEAYYELSVVVAMEHSDDLGERAEAKRLYVQIETSFGA